MRVRRGLGVFEKKQFQFWREIQIWALVILLQLYNNAFLTFELPCFLQRLRDWLHFVLIDMKKLNDYCF